MKVVLAGFNVDAEVLARLNSENRETLTPETFSAAYARISRSEKDVALLRRQACLDVASARKSNRRIVYAMGHHSVAEHAVFNFDVSGISRLALEILEHFRLVSFTEKSQRYVKIDGPFIVPEEIGLAEDHQAFKKVVFEQFDFYRKSIKRIEEYLKLEAASRDDEKKIAEWAKEDARYVLPLACEAQLGMTVNGRNLEYMIRSFQAHELAEVRKLGAQLHRQGSALAPSIVLFTDPSPFDLKQKKLFSDCPAGPDPGENKVPDSMNRIVYCTTGGDDLILEALGFTLAGLPFPGGKGAFPGNAKKRIYLDLFSGMEFFDRPPREFELVDVVFSTVVSASCFAQLKRHRMATLLVHDYEPELGNIMPEIFYQLGIDGEFRRVQADTFEVYRKLRERFGRPADYVLTNSHCRRVLVKMNLREIYHFSRLREDEHAQWEIRRLAAWLSSEVRARVPLAGMMLGGKSDFKKLLENLQKARID